MADMGGMVVMGAMGAIGVMGAIDVMGAIGVMGVIDVMGAIDVMGGMGVESDICPDCWVCGPLSWLGFITRPGSPLDTPAEPFPKKEAFSSCWRLPNFS